MNPTEFDCILELIASWLNYFLHRTHTVVSWYL